MKNTPVKGERLIAAVLDYIFLIVFQIIPSIILIMMVDINELLDWFLDAALTVPPQDFIYFTIGSSISAVIIGLFLYVLIPTYKNGQTLGKMIMKVKVVDEGGNNPKMRTHFVRAIEMWGNFLSLPFVFLLPISYYTATGITSMISTGAFIALLVAFIMILSSPDERGIHDKIAKTYVIHAGETLNQEPTAKPMKQDDDDWLSDMDDDVWSK